MVLTTLAAKEESVVGLATTTKMVLIMEYDGRRYHGFQLQAGQPTIQGAIEEALGRLPEKRPG